MPYSSQHLPAYRHHKSRGLGVVTLNGKDIYLGPYNSEQSRRKYDRLIQEWLASGRTITSQSPVEEGQFSVAELILAYLDHARVFYRRDGEATSHFHNVEDALSYLKDLYGLEPVACFSPLRLKAVQQQMIGKKLSRSTINKYVGCLKRMFRWGTENELVPPTVFHGLQAVGGLRKGRSDAKENGPVKPVPEQYVEAVKPYLSKQVNAMIQLQLVTGMRPGEVVAMRGVDIDRSAALWIYTPVHHKTEHHGHVRPVYLGPTAQEILTPFLVTDSSAYLFSPMEAMASYHAERRRLRKTKITPSQAKRKRRPVSTVGNRYTTESYRRAIARACKQADLAARQAIAEASPEVVFVPQWHPHQLRHNAATRLRREYGLDAARVVLGHRSAAVTEVYAEVDHAKAQEVMSKAG